MRQAHGWFVASAVALFLAAACLGQSAPDKKSYTFHGKVEAVNATTIKVNGEKVEGWMEAMTMDYKVDDSAIIAICLSGNFVRIPRLPGRAFSLTAGAGAFLSRPPPIDETGVFRPGGSLRNRY